MSRDDELARTATADSGAPATGLAAPLRATLGRYRLERELGAGGMGVVHAAFDPDLERRVALKVLRSAASGDEARQRLLREARAMARLTHPNVVVVHEVSTADGRDYIAMELVDGGTVDEWLRAARRSPAEVLATFVAAGRGLAAAHAAGLVHRDFKPHNILRGRDGRVVVTDFGLARGVDATPDPLATTLDPAAAAATDTPSSLTGLTRTGSVLGTPAYMAPEQWRGTVGPASDQFAFCVALWEALAGERPFRGENVAILRREVERGVAPAELARLPRAVRGVLARGLDPDPAKRWPTMDALLAQLAGVVAEPARGRSLPVVATAAAALAFIAVGAALTYGGRQSAVAIAPPPPCAAPPIALDEAWTPALEKSLIDAGQASSATAIAADAARLGPARAAACAAGDAGAARRACLDGVVARLAAVARGTAAVHAPDHTDAGELLIDPAICDLVPTPRVAPPSAALAEVLQTELALLATSQPADAVALRALVDRVASDPCASAVAALLASEADRAGSARAALGDRAAADVARCDDDRTRADVAIGQAGLLVSTGLERVETRPKLQLAEALAARVMQPDMRADLAQMKEGLAEAAGDTDEAIAQAEAAAAGFAARGRVGPQIVAQLQALELRGQRGLAADVAAVEPGLRELRSRAVAALGEHDPVLRRIDLASAYEDFHRGRAPEAHRELQALEQTVPQITPRRVAGHVVDASGAPVAGATVYAGPMLSGDAQSAMLDWGQSGRIRSATTDATGAFAIGDAPHDGTVVAEAGALRSWAVPIADDVRLQVAPTTRLEGKVELSGLLARNVVIAVVKKPVTYQIVAPVAEDGTFRVDGVPPGDVTIVAQSMRGAAEIAATSRVHVAGPVVGGLRLAMPTSGRTVQMIVRSTVNAGPGNAQVMLVAGKTPPRLTVAAARREIQLRSVQLARAIQGENAPAPVLAQAHAGDLFATLREVGAGEMSACAIALPEEVSDPAFMQKVEQNLDKLEVVCTPIPAGADVVSIAVPPWPRLD